MSPSVLFHVKQRAINEEANANNPQHQQRMTAAWGTKQCAVDDYLVAQDGDHLMVPFKCNLCVSFESYTIKRLPQLILLTIYCWPVFNKSSSTLFGVG
jgi:hypothetical protein